MFRYGIDTLTVNKVIAISKGSLKTILTKEAIKKVTTCRQKVETLANSNNAVYGINTGFGPLCDVQITPEQTNKLQENLLITHAVGVGNSIEKNLSKIMMILKVHALCQGFSGIRLHVIERILYFIEHDLIPVVPEQGSVGASGDLAPLSHLFLPLLGEGEFWLRWLILAAVYKTHLLFYLHLLQTHQLDTRKHHPLHHFEVLVTENLTHLKVLKFLQ